MEGRYLAADDTDRVQEGECIGVLIGLERGLMHETANGEMRHQQPEEFLLDQIRRLAAQDDLCTAQVRLQFVQGRLDFPALVIECRQLFCGSLSVVENGGEEAIDWLGIGDAVEAILDDADLRAGARRIRAAHWP